MYGFYWQNFSIYKNIYPQDIVCKPASMECLQLSSLKYSKATVATRSTNASFLVPAKSEIAAGQLCTLPLSNGSTGNTAAQIRLQTGTEMALRHVGSQFSLVCLSCLCLLGDVMRK